MKIYVLTDMEGVSGVSGSDFVMPDGRFYAEGRRYLTWDINACVRGCFNGGAEAVVVQDGHGGGCHAIWEELDPRMEIIRGDTGRLRLPAVEECDAVILLGYHALAGTGEALLEHSYSSKTVQNMWLNGRLAGEIGVDAAVAGDAGVPVIMVSGDDRACAEAREWIPGVVTCQVKVGLSCQGARLLSKENAHRLIEERAAQAVGQIGSVPPVKVDRPVTIRVEKVERGTIPNELARPDVRVIDARTYEVTGETVEEAFSRVFG